MDHLLVPFLPLRMKNRKKVWLDAYFSKKLNERFRIASLVRGSKTELISGKEVKDEKSMKKLDPILNPSEFKDLILKILKDVESQLEVIKSERGRFYGKWNLLRVLFIPFGWSRRIREDEINSRLQRELTYSKEILMALSHSLPLNEVSYLVIGIRNGRPADKIYMTLYDLDQGFRKSFDEVVGGTEKEEMDG